MRLLIQKVDVMANAVDLIGDRTTALEGAVADVSHGRCMRAVGTQRLLLRLTLRPPRRISGNSRTRPGDLPLNRTYLH